MSPTDKALLFGRESVLSFAHLMSDRFRSAPHLRTIAKLIHKMERREIKKAMVFTPPRHGKSHLISEMFPAWYLGRHPDHNVVMASYGQDLASDFGRKIRNMMSEDIYRAIFPGITLSDDSTAAARFHTNHGGACYSVGIGSALTGKGGNLLLIDDPTKDREDANSLVMRERVWGWYSSTFSTRQMPDAVMLLIMTRWHPDDLAGRILASEDGPNWTVVQMPAINEAGEALWPERYPLDALMAIKKGMILSDWQSLYMQHPTLQEGAIIKRHWWRYYTQLPKTFDRIVQSWDFAVKDKKGSDYTVGLVIGKLGPNKYVLDMVRERLSFPDACQAVINTTIKWPKATKKLIEGKANGPAVVQTLRTKISGMVEVEPEGDKVQRANAISPEIEAGNWFLPSPAIAPWVNVFLQEASDFPNSTNDDIVDALSMAGIELMGSGGIGKLHMIDRNF